MGKDIYIHMYIDIYIYNGILFSHENKENLPFATMWIKLEDIMKSGEKNSDRASQMLYELTYTQNLK